MRRSRRSRPAASRRGRRPLRRVRCSRCSMVRGPMIVACRRVFRRPLRPAARVSRWRPGRHSGLGGCAPFPAESPPWPHEETFRLRLSSSFRSFSHPALHESFTDEARRLGIGVASRPALGAVGARDDMERAQATSVRAWDDESGDVREDGRPATSSPSKPSRISGATRNTATAAGSTERAPTRPPQRQQPGEARD